MRMSDWSSDVCSSDLEAPRKTQHQRLAVAVINVARRARNDGFGNAVTAQLPAHARRDVDQQITLELAPHRDKTVIRNTVDAVPVIRSEEHTSELQSLMRISTAVFCLKKKKISINKTQVRPTDQYHTH